MAYSKQIILTEPDVIKMYQVVSDLIELHAFYQQIQTKWIKRLKELDVEVTKENIEVLIKMDKIFLSTISTLINLSGLPVTEINPN